MTTLTYNAQNMPEYLPANINITYDWAVLDTLKHSKPAAYTAVLERLFAVWLKVLPRDIIYCLQTIRAELAMRAGDTHADQHDLYWLTLFSKNPVKYIKGCAELADTLESQYFQQHQQPDSDSDDSDDPQAPQL